MDTQNSMAGTETGAQLLDAEKVEQIKEGLGMVHGTFAEFVHPLTENQRKHSLHTGMKKGAFAEEAFSTANENPDLVPAYSGGINRFADAHEDYTNRKMLCFATRQILQEMEDGVLVSGEAFYRLALDFYDYVKKAAQRGDPLALVIFNALKSHFEKTHHAKNNEEQE